MRFLSMIRVDEKTGQKPSERLMTEMGKLIEEAALDLTYRFLGVHGDEWNVECEIRPLDGPEFGCRA
jgi:hypothetical protein